MSTTRRDFLGAGAAAAAGLLVGPALEAHRAVPAATLTAAGKGAAGRVTVLSSANGIRGVAKAYDQITRGTDTLDAIIAGVNIEELDPENDSVGLGGLPNEDGVVQLDASCMHGPTKRAGAVGCLEDIATPSLVAKAVMDYTDHTILVGRGARKFALAVGFKEQNLLTEKSRQNWLRWKANLNKDDFWLDHDEDIKIRFTTGTINMNAVNAAGDLSSVTTTSGMSFKLDGRIGDSPIVGAGQYCDNAIGAAGSTGRGEACMKVCGAYTIVEFMRNGMTPEQACLKALERVVAMTEKRLLDDKGRPRFGLQFYALAKDGRVGGATLYEGAKYAVCDEKGARLESCAPMYARTAMPRGAW